jgi:hypothetical protein
MLAIIGTRSLVISDLHGNQREWTVPPRESLVDWSADGRSLLFWDGRTGRVHIRSPLGKEEGMRGGRYPALPVLAPDHQHLAFVYRGTLQLGTWAGMRRTVPVPASCRAASWSGDSARLLLACGGQAEMRGRNGALVRRIALPDTATWAPGSHNLLFFRDDALWRWDSHGTHQLVSDASPAASL